MSEGLALRSLGVVLGFSVSGFKVGVPGSRFRVYGVWLRGSGLGFWV